MAANNSLLDTSTVNMYQLLGTNSLYRVPAYQRDYSWKEENWEDLWNDILALKDSESAVHYMGSIVLQSDIVGKFLVIDGQQRFTTLSILALVFISKIENLNGDPNKQRAQILKRLFIGDINPVTLITLSKLSLNDTDDEYYQTYLVQNKNPLSRSAMPESSKLMFKAFEFFSKKIDELDEASNDGEQLAAFLSDIIAQRLIFIQIHVRDELSAYTVFETLNARGVDLSSTDLLKNYLFSLAGGNNIEYFSKSWRRISNSVGSEKLPEFLRYYYNSKYPFVRTNRLFKSITEKVSEATEAVEFLREIEKESITYAALNDASHDKWHDYEPVVRKWVKVLNIFRVTQMMPLLLAADRCLPPDVFKSIIRMSAIITMRWSVIGKRNTNELEHAYNRAARRIESGVIKTPKDVFEEVKSVYINDEIFNDEFLRAKILANQRQKRVLRYILSTIESSKSGIEIDSDESAYTVEHILPQNPSKDWGELPADYLQEYSVRLGNMMMLEASINKDIGNSFISEKLIAYQRSKLQLPKEITSTIWKDTQIEARQKAMADLAVNHWRLDY